jgi:hypothetical protein
MEKISVRTNGGMGKQLMSIPVVKQIRHKYPEATIHVQTSYPEVYANLPFVDKYFPLGNVPYFYDEHKDFEVIEFEPYLDLEYRMGNCHLVEAWCRRLNLDIPKDFGGEIVLDSQEIEIAERIFMQFKLDRPLIAFQYCGGTSYYSPQDAMNPTRAKHYRDLKFETAQEICDGLVKAGLAVLQIGLPTERPLKNALLLNDKEVVNPRVIFSLLNKCHGGIFIDSFAQHAWKALGKEKALVLWGGTSPVNLGYTSNVNLTNEKSCQNLHCGRPNTFMMDVMGNGNLWKCPINGKCMDFSPQRVVEKYMQIHNEKQEAQKKNGPIPLPTNPS